VRALLIVNPQATSTRQLRHDVIVRALASDIDLEVVQTRYRGHAAVLAAEAVQRGLDIVLPVGGDGTVNETVNGLLGRTSTGPAGTGPAGTGPAGTGPAGTGPAGTGQADTRQADAGSADTGQTDAGQAGVKETGGGRADELPVLAPIPGGNANVFIRSLGQSMDPIDATGRILAAIAAGQSRRIGLGLAGGRYFTFCAGLGIDAEVVRAIEGLRASGRKASDALYVMTTLGQYFFATDRRHPALTLERNGHPPVDHLFVSMISNTTPWTYLGHRPVNPSPQANYDAGLDVFALRRLRTVSTLNAIRQMLTAKNGGPNGRQVLSLHDQPAFTLRSSRPIALQVDGEYMGEHECVAFHSVPRALRVIG
jgi:diacylglycerol kinase family enzyme